MVVQDRDLLAPPEFEDPLIGLLIQDRYRILKRLGAGGMGVVYLAEHVLIRRKVAIKTLHPHYTKDAGIVSRFHLEALAATEIGNEHIIEVTDMGRLDDGALFMVLDMPGKDSLICLSRGPPRSRERI